MTRRHIALIGFSTTGKSTVAQRLAARLGWSALDTDQVIVATAGQPIHALFKREGEAAFRQREAAALQAALAGERKVIATGGGIVTLPDNRAALADSAYRVWLTARPETVVARLRQAAPSEPRPLLDAPDPLVRIQELLARREALYREADLVVETDERTPDEVTQIILDWFQPVSSASVGLTGAGGE